MERFHKDIVACYLYAINRHGYPPAAADSLTHLDEFKELVFSSIELHVSKGAVLLGSTDPGNYPEMVTPCRFYGDDWVKKSLIFGASLENSAMWMQHHLACDRVLIEDIKVWNL